MGRHSLLMIGPPGTGKTMLASRIPGILPPLSRTESLAITGIYSARRVPATQPACELPPSISYTGKQTTDRTKGPLGSQDLRVGEQPNSAEAIRSAWDRRAEAYAAMIENPMARGLAAEIELAAFERELAGGTSLRVLDAGCGVGFHGTRLLAKGYDVTFCDISPRMLELARGRAQRHLAPCSRFVTADIRCMPQITTASYDAVISGGTVLSDCGDPVAAIREVARVLRPGGIAGLSVRNLDGPQQQPPRRACVPQGGAGFDWWFFSLESAHQLCAVAGLECRRICPVLAAAPDSTTRECYVRQHLDGNWDDQLRAAAYELFIIAYRP